MTVENYFVLRHLKRRVWVFRVRYGLVIDDPALHKIPVNGCAAEVNEACCSSPLGCFDQMFQTFDHSGRTAPAAIDDVMAPGHCVGQLILVQNISHLKANREPCKASRPCW